ncbi:MAG: Fe-S protein assembly co-chaperone HscB [Granulosicoccus sp.]|nr:Fe-S protein assembly co-chaperone HscB [Granulosicoccus sp.]
MSNNYFQLFGLPVEFEIARSRLISNYRELQKQLHPDKFAAASDAERRWSMQAASHVNEGYQTLDNDLRRAVYLLQLNDISVDEETDTHMAPEFLMQQMELRESLEVVQSAEDPSSGLKKIKSEINISVKEQASQFALSASESDWVKARNTVRQWQFLDKLLREIKMLEERLDA